MSWFRWQMNTNQPAGLAAYYFLFYTLFTVDALIYCQILGRGTTRRGNFWRWLVVYFCFGPKVCGLLFYILLYCPLYSWTHGWLVPRSNYFIGVSTILLTNVKTSFYDNVKIPVPFQIYQLCTFWPGQIQFKFKQNWVFATNNLMHTKYLYVRS